MDIDLGSGYLLFTKIAMLSSFNPDSVNQVILHPILSNPTPEREGGTCLRPPEVWLGREIFTKITKTQLKRTILKKTHVP